VAYNRRDYRQKWRIERHAAAVRGKLGLDQLTPLDALQLADALPAHVFYPEDFGDGPLARKLQKIKWDGFAFGVADGTLMIVLNSARPSTRQTATLMEELAHHLLGHKPCRIATNAQTGFLERSYDRAQESEAYDLGAALLLPKERIQRDVAAECSAAEIAAVHSCSVDLVVYCFKRLRLCQR
jgi:hypothetical protein